VSRPCIGRSPSSGDATGNYGDKTVKQFRVDKNLGNESSGRVDSGVILRLDELFPP
jgi:hypothetical protein